MSLLIFAVLLLVVVLAAVLFLRERVASIVQVAAVIAFVCFAAVALSALFVPGVYDAAADATLDAIGLLGRIQQLDKQLAPLAAVSDMARDGELAASALGQILDNDSVGPLLRRLGVDASDLLPSDAATASAEPARIVEDALYGSLVSLVSGMYRILALAVSVPGMIAVVGLGYAASVVGDARRNRQTLVELEARVAQLESDRHNLAAE